MANPMRVRKHKLKAVTEDGVYVAMCGRRVHSHWTTNLNHETQCVACHKMITKELNQCSSLAQ